MKINKETKQKLKHLKKHIQNSCSDMDLFLCLIAMIYHKGKIHILPLQSNEYLLECDESLFTNNNKPCNYYILGQPCFDRLCLRLEEFGTLQNDLFFSKFVPSSLKIEDAFTVIYK